MNRYEKQNAANRIDGYYYPTIDEYNTSLAFDAFLRAKKETIKHMKKALRDTEELTYEDFFLETGRKQSLERIHARKDILQIKLKERQ